MGYLIGASIVLAPVVILIIVLLATSKQPKVSIDDVPCISCQSGYNFQHVCSIPNYCPCDQSHLHVEK